MKHKRASKHSEQPLFWLPVDSRLISPIFSFGHVKGIARVFMTLEMILATTVVLGTLASVIFYYY